MTKTKLSLCRKGIINKMVDAESADFVQDLCLRLQSAAGTLESAFQECISIYDNLEQAANAEPIAPAVPVAIEFPSEAIDAKDEVIAVADMIREVLLEGARNLEAEGIVWYANEEKVQAEIDNVWVDCWHMETDNGVATICLEYLGGPRIDVPVSSLRRISE